MIPLIFLFCLGGVVCLMPLGCYLLWLAALHRRDRPTVVPGGWDFTALALGLSGCILYGGGLLLTLVRSNVRYGLRGNFKALRDAWDQEGTIWAGAVLTYLIVAVAGVVLIGRARRRTLVVYNADPELVEADLADLFDRLGRPAERRGDLWSFAGRPVLELEPFPTARTVTLRWLADDRVLAQEVTRHLGTAGLAAHDGDSPVAPWLLTGTTFCAVSAACCAGLLVYGLALIR